VFGIGCATAQVTASDEAHINAAPIRASRVLGIGDYLFAP
jgi:hypothetical protein